MQPCAVLTDGVVVGAGPCCTNNLLGPIGAWQADGCGPGRDLPRLAALLNATGRPVLIENCHYYKWPNSSLPKGVGPDRVNRVWPYWKDNVTGGELICPENLFRASGDIANSWSSWFGNLATLGKYQDEHHPISRPGCWACEYRSAGSLVPQHLTGMHADADSAWQTRTC